jgi:hypothetical protein
MSNGWPTGGTMTIGGRDSVTWSIQAYGIRKHESRELGPKKYRQAGVAETRPGSQFSVEIRVPEDQQSKAGFLTALKAAADFPSERVALKLPIESFYSDQITITWEGPEDGPERHLPTTNVQRWRATQRLRATKKAKRRRH